MSDTRNYRLVYPDPRTNEDEPSGGYVELHGSHETELTTKTEIVLARIDYQELRLDREDALDGTISRKIQ